MSDRRGAVNTNGGGGLTLGNLSVLGEESEDEGREEEIRELLAHAFSTETLGDEDEDDRGRGTSSLDNVVPIQRNVLDINAGGERSQGTVSLFHRSHCPAVGGDTNGNYQATWPSDGVETLEELKTLAEFRERQVQRVEDQLETLSKEKRALAHKLALLKTEVLEMKSTEDELRRTLDSKQEEVDFLKEKVSQVLGEYEGARKNENETKDHNIRLQSRVEKLTQEVKLLSAIGLSTKESELNDALREMRQKHASEVNFLRQKVAELELSLQKYEQDEIAPTTNGRHQVKPSDEIDGVAQTSFDIDAELIAQRERHYSEKTLWKRHLTSLETRIQDLLKPRDCRSMEIQTDRKEPTEASHNSILRVGTAVEVQTEGGPTEYAKGPRDYATVEIQTDESMETFRILGSLIESWVAEVTEAEARANKSEAEAAELTTGLRLLKTKFRMLKKLVMMCRREWSSRETLLIQRCNTAENRFYNFLVTLGDNFTRLEQSLPPQST